MKTVKRVVIIEDMEVSKVSPYETPKVLAEKAAVRAETNSSVIEHVDFSQYEKTDAERSVLKQAKLAYNKIKTNFKEREALIKEIISHRPPNWGSIRVILCKN